MQPASFEQISLMTFGMVYLSGIVTSFTPCVYPMIPVVTGYLGSIGGGLRGKFIASIGYVMGLSLVYAALGVIAAITGNIFGDLTSNAYVYLGFGILLLVLGGSLMDWYPLPVPVFSGRRSDQKERPPIVASFLMGCTSGLVASPCTAPVLAGLLMYVGSTRDVVRGAALMFTFALGMNTILLIIGFSVGSVLLLPKAGRWMEYIKKGLALIILGAGIFFVFKAGTYY